METWELLEILNDANCGISDTIVTGLEDEPLAPLISRIVFCEVASFEAAL